jgi:hypothetical protein
MAAKRITISLEEETYKAVRLYALYSCRSIGAVCGDAIKAHLHEIGAENLKIVNQPGFAKLDPFDSNTARKEISANQPDQDG